MLGTGCVTLAGIIAAARAAKGKITDMRFMCVGEFTLSASFVS